MKFRLIIKSPYFQNLLYVNLLLQKMPLTIKVKKIRKSSSTFSQSLQGKSKEKFQFHLFAFQYEIVSNFSKSATLNLIKSILLFLPSGCFINLQNFSNL